MKDHAIAKRIGQQILKVVGDHQKKWEDTIGKVQGITDLLMEAVAKRL